MSDLFSSAVAKIRSAYERLGHTRGWRFLTTPRNTLGRDADVAFITANPGGSAVDPAQGLESCERGSAYVYESWSGFPPGQSPLQRQVQAMFRWLGRDPDETLSAYFVPFRSPSFAQLIAPHESLAFAADLWRGIFAEIHPALIVCLGAETEKGLFSIFGVPNSRRAFPVAWGSQTAGLNQYDNHVLLRFPHLSRFGIFGRPASDAALETIRREISL